MSNILIRNGQQKDAEILSKIYASSWKHAYRGIVPDEYLKNLKDDFWDGVKKHHQKQKGAFSPRHQKHPNANFVVFYCMAITTRTPCFKVWLIPFEQYNSSVSTFRFFTVNKPQFECE